MLLLMPLEFTVESSNAESLISTRRISCLDVKAAAVEEASVEEEAAVAEEEEEAAVAEAAATAEAVEAALDVTVVEEAEEDEAEAEEVNLALGLQVCSRSSERDINLPAIFSHVFSDSLALVLLILKPPCPRPRCPQSSVVRALFDLVLVVLVDFVLINVGRQ